MPTQLRDQQAVVPDFDLPGRVVNVQLHLMPDVVRHDNAAGGRRIGAPVVETEPIRRIDIDAHEVISVCRPETNQVRNGALAFYIEAGAVVQVSLGCRHLPIRICGRA